MNMPHWVDPYTRGVYRHPAAQPPTPQPNASNHVLSRLAVVEAHLQFAAANQQRDEEESRRRAADLGEGIAEVDEKVDKTNVRMDLIEDRLEVLEQERHTRLSIWGMLSTFGSSAKESVRYLITIILTALVLSGMLTVEKLSAIKSLWGAGSPG